MIDFEEHVPQKKHLDLTPLIDVVFLLLIFFILTSASVRPMLPLNLPEAETAAPKKESTVAITLKLDGSIYVNEELVDSQNLSQVLAAFYSKSADKDLNLASDKGVAFGKVVEVLDIAQKAGAQNISVVTDKKAK